MLVYSIKSVHCPLFLLKDEKERPAFLIHMITHEFDNRVRILFSGPEDKLLNPRDLIYEF